MLFFTKKIGEAIVIDNEITLSIISARGDDICIGIESPKSISVNRREIQAKTSRSRKLVAYAQEILKDRAIAKLYSLDEILFERLLQGSPFAQFEVALKFYQANEFKLAQEVFELSLRQGIRESKYYLERIHQKNQRKYFTDKNHMDKY